MPGSTGGVWGAPHSSEAMRTKGDDVADKCPVLGNSDIGSTNDKFRLNAMQVVCELHVELRQLDVEPVLLPRPFGDGWIQTPSGPE